jgi:conjugal transfer pilus assembly protein TraB
MEKLKQRWQTLDAKQKKWAIIAGIVAAVLLLAVLGGGASTTKPERVAKREKPVATVLADDRGEADISKLNAQSKEMAKQFDQLKRSNEELTERLNKVSGQLGGLNALKDNPEEFGKILDELNRLRGDLDTIKTGEGAATTADPLATGGAAPAKRPPPMGDPFAGKSSGVTSDIDPLANVAGRGATGTGARVMPAVQTADEAPQILIDAAAQQAATGATRGRSNGSRVAQTSRDARGEAVAGAGADAVFLPSGSLFGGVLLNGMDAPTGRGAVTEPYPVTVRLTSLAFLPNRFSTDVKECFVLAAGTGRLDDERVHLRTERLSCVTRAGRVIDIAIEGYLTGEDGKVGLRGTVVERTGTLLARAALAGFGSGLADALQPRVRTSVQTGSDAGGLEFVAPDVGEVLEVGAYAGAANAMQRIADFYLERAEQIFPVIELDAMRPVTVHLTKGVELKLREGGTWSEVSRGGS